MNSLSLRLSIYKEKVYKDIKMLVFDMAGTTINEKGIVYETLFDTMSNFGLNVSKNDICKWHGLNNYEVLNNYLTNDKKVSDEINNCIKEQLYSNFDNNLKERYFTSSNIDLIDENLLVLFDKIRKKDIKVTLNTGYSKEIQESIIKKLNMNEFIDDYISSEEVKYGRPYPHMIHKLMERNNITNSQNVIKFGDTNNDVLEGINANCIASIGVLSGADSFSKLKNASHVINSIMDIDE
tara:strand:- start:1534 stop:2247 length:714 start_codon:yes stop_codon:yes gene_type:complete